MEKQQQGKEKKPRPKCQIHFGFGKISTSFESGWERPRECERMRGDLRFDDLIIEITVFDCCPGAGYFGFPVHGSRQSSPGRERRSKAVAGGPRSVVCICVTGLSVSASVCTARRCVLFRPGVDGAKKAKSIRPRPTVRGWC